MIATRRRRAVAALSAACIVAACSGSDSSPLVEQEPAGVDVTTTEASPSSSASEPLPSPSETEVDPPISPAGIVPRSELEVRGDEVAPPLAEAPLPTNQWWSALLEPQPGTTLWAFPIAARMQSDGLAFGAGRVVRSDVGVVETLFIPELRVATSTAQMGVVDHGSHSVTYEIDVTDGTSGDVGNAGGSRSSLPTDGATYGLAVVDGQASVVPLADEPVPLPDERFTAQVSMAQGWPFARLTAAGPIELYVQGGTVTEIESGLDVHLEITSEHGVWDVVSPVPVSWRQEVDRIVFVPETAIDLTFAARPLDPPLEWLSAVVDVARHPLVGTSSSTTNDWSSGVVRQELRWDRVGATEPGVLALMPHHQETLIGEVDALGQYLVAQGRLDAVRADEATIEVPMRSPLLALPDLDAAVEHPAYDFAQILSSEAVIAPTGGGSYFFGKQLARSAALAELAAISGDETSASAALDIVATGLLDVALSEGGDDERFAVRDPELGGVFIVPAEFGNERYNDHHFQYAYLIRAAATLFELDPDFADTDAGRVVEGLIRALVDGVTGQGPGGPGVRVWNPYEGHSYATGISESGAGPNQESSSEAVHAWEAIARWALVVGDSELAEQALAWWSLEAFSARHYWLGGVDYPPEYQFSTTGIYWAAKLDFATFFDARPEAAIGIQLLPVTMGSLYRSPSYGSLDHLSGIGDPASADLWPDIFVMEQAMTDAAAASEAIGTLDEIEPGNSLSMLLYWVHLMETLGTPSTAVHADAPGAAAFDGPDGVTLVARNVGSAPIEVGFRDRSGLEVGRLNVEAGATVVEPCAMCSEVVTSS